MRAKKAVVCGKDGAVAAVSPKGNPAEGGSCVSPKGMEKNWGRSSPAFLLRWETRSFLWRGLE